MPLLPTPGHRGPALLAGLERFHKSPQGMTLRSHGREPVDSTPLARSEPPQEGGTTIFLMCAGKRQPGIGHKGKMPLLPTPDIAVRAGQPVREPSIAMTMTIPIPMPMPMPIPAGGMCQSGIGQGQDALATYQEPVSPVEKKQEHRHIGVPL
jgi:hypothetical protein